MAKVMTINSGSSSLKFKLYEMPEEKVICSGNAERIGESEGIFTIKFNGEKKESHPIFKDHGDAAKMVVDSLIENKIITSFDEIKAIGHRIVQGGKYFNKSAMFNEDTEKKIESLIPLAPLHNAAHLTCFKAFKKVLPNCPAIATFDTAFHQSMEPQDYVFPIPYELTTKYDIRRYGAHGTSHNYLAIEGEKYLEGTKHRIISCHIGSGASITAIKDGKCVATSMGLTPLGGIMMGTRTGDLDPSVFNYVCKVTGKSAEEVYQMFNKESGYKGVSGVGNDSRVVLKACEEGNKQAILSNDIFVRRIADFIGQYFVRLGGADLIIFSAGIGENSAETRWSVYQEIKEALGIEIDEAKNKEARGKEMLISTPNSKIKVAVIPTDEEVMIARDAYKMCILGK